MNEAGVSVSLPFSTTTTSLPAASSSPSAPLLVVGSSPSNSWFTSPWMSEGRRSPSLLETVNLWLMVVAGETSDGSSCHGAGWRGRIKAGGNCSRFSRYCSPPSPSSKFTHRLLWPGRTAALCPVIRRVMPSGPSHQPVSGGCRAPGS